MIALLLIAAVVLACVAYVLLQWALDLRHKLRDSKGQYDRALAEYELATWKRDYPELTCRPDRRCDASRQP